MQPASYVVPRLWKTRALYATLMDATPLCGVDSRMVFLRDAHSFYMLCMNLCYAYQLTTIKHKQYSHTGSRQSC